jgi:coproporphyrinogen III oxidase
MITSTITQIRNYLLKLQKDLCQQLSTLDGKESFQQDHWERKNSTTLAGSGLTCILKDGAIFEKAGINFSHVKGDSLPSSAKSILRSTYENKSFEALGVSIVIHPYNPYVPTSHFNIRFFSIENEHNLPSWWFGGGYDLTPSYGFEEDCQHWHATAKAACEPFGSEIYPELKRWCDEYFYLKHRQEARGVGGLFFDDWHRWDLERCFEFMQSIGNSYGHAYFPIVEKRKHMAFGLAEKQFQKIRRGRYAEFNLLYDRGTLFGLQSGGRTESILMSLPPEVSWEYEYSPVPGTPEALLSSHFLTPTNWV